MSQDLSTSILHQIEFYFSDSNLRKDKFLNEKMNSNEEGYVLIDVLLTFNRLKKLTEDKNIIAESIKESQVVEVSEDKLSIRRKNRFTLESNNQHENCTIYVENLGKEMEIEQVAPIFMKYGNVKLVQIFRSPLNKDKKRVPQGAAFIEFSTPEEAQAAMKDLIPRDSTKFYAKMIQEGDFDIKAVRCMTKTDYKAFIEAKSAKKSGKTDDKTRPSIPDCLVEITGITPAESLTSFTLKQFLGDIRTPRFVDYETGEKAVLRFLSGEDATFFIEECTKRVFAIQGSPITARLMTADEQSEYFKMVKTLPKNESKGGRGGRGGRGRGGKRGGGRGGNRRDRSRSPLKTTGGGDDRDRY